jgi:hypothetical protein
MLQASSMSHRQEIRVRNQKARIVNALDRRQMTVAEHASSNDVEKVINNAKDNNDQYGYLTALQIEGYSNLRNEEFGQAEESFSVIVLEGQKPNAYVSWWHKMTGWLGLGVTLYASDQSKYDKALGYCLMAEYVSAMLGLRVDVTRGISTLLLEGKLLSTSAMVEKIGKDKDIRKEKMQELRHKALIQSGLQKVLLEELSGASWSN